MKNLIIIRALPGAGKSTLAELIGSANPDSSVICTTDDFPGLYTHDDEHGIVFNGMQYVDGVPMIVKAHEWNHRMAETAMETGAFSTVIVPNTNVQRWEFQAYLDLAETYGYRTTVISLFDGGCSDEELLHRNTHGVPLQAISAMRARFEHDWVNADPRNPRERE